ncbi:MAG: hypothetical protein IKS47_01590, partial [Bacteroidales bacterium]|nr:hypothetical protein [Bacteroidales bacterium]
SLDGLAAPARGLLRLLARRLELRDHRQQRLLRRLVLVDQLLAARAVVAHLGEALLAADACGAAETFALWMGKKQEDLLGTAVFGDPGLASAIQADKLGIGLNNIGYAYDEKSRKPNQGLLVCPIDRDNDGVITSDEYFYDTKDDFIAAVAEDKYPSPPARDLYLVSHGTPKNPAVIAFLEYVLTDGQKQNVPVGYISLNEEKLQKGLEKLGVKN